MVLRDGEYPIVVPRPEGVQLAERVIWLSEPAPDSVDAVADLLQKHLQRPDKLSRTDLGLREAAVLVPLLEGESGPELVLTKRSGMVSTHRGEIAFPGGGRDPEDSDLWATALREVQEEIGLKREHVSPIGHLDPLVTVGSRFLLTPCVGILQESAEIVPASLEVDRILQVPIARLLEPAVFREEIWPWPGGERRSVYFFELDEDDVIWGATGRIIFRLLQILLGSSSSQNET